MYTFLVAFWSISDPFPSCSAQLLSGPSRKGVESVRQVAYFGLLREGSEKVAPEVVPECPGTGPKRGFSVTYILSGASLIGPSSVQRECFKISKVPKRPN